MTSTPLHRCASPSCPGYPWAASDAPHPCPPAEVAPVPARVDPMDFLRAWPTRIGAEGYAAGLAAGGVNVSTLEIRESRDTAGPVRVWFEVWIHADHNPAARRRTCTECNGDGCPTCRGSGTIHPDGFGCAPAGLDCTADRTRPDEAPPGHDGNPADEDDRPPIDDRTRLLAMLARTTGELSYVRETGDLRDSQRNHPGIVAEARALLVEIGGPDYADDDWTPADDDR